MSENPQGGPLSNEAPKSDFPPVLDTGDIVFVPRSGQPQPEGGWMIQKIDDRGIAHLRKPTMKDGKPTPQSDLIKKVPLGQLRQVNIPYYPANVDQVNDLNGFRIFLRSHQGIQTEKGFFDGLLLANRLNDFMKTGDRAKLPREDGIRDKAIELRNKIVASGK